MKEVRGDEFFSPKGVRDGARGPVFCLVREGIVVTPCLGAAAPARKLDTSKVSVVENGG